MTVITCPRYEYADRCEAAATASGLDPLTDRLADQGISHQVEQTGGMTMVVTVPARDGVYGITCDGDDDDRPWLVCFYPGTTWDDGDLCADWSECDLDTVIDRMHLTAEEATR